MSIDVQVYIGKEDLDLYGKGVKLKPQTEGSAGIDIMSTENCAIYPGQRMLVKTGLHTAFGKDYVLSIRPRSGMAFKKGITVLNSPGTVDSDYRDEIGVILMNHGENPVGISRGDRIAQAVFTKVYIPDVILVENLDDLGTTGRKGGFGHTGTKEVENDNNN